MVYFIENRNLEWMMTGGLYIYTYIHTYIHNIYIYIYIHIFMVLGQKPGYLNGTHPVIGIAGF